MQQPPVGLGKGTSPAKSPSPANILPSAAVSKSAGDTSADPDLLKWVNVNLPASCAPVPDLSKSLRSGRPIVRLLENLSGQQSGISDASFEQFNQDSGLTFDPAYLDTLFSGKHAMPEKQRRDSEAHPRPSLRSVRLHQPARVYRRHLDGGHDDRQY